MPLISMVMLRQYTRFESNRYFIHDDQADSGVQDFGGVVLTQEEGDRIGAALGTLPFI